MRVLEIPQISDTLSLLWTFVHSVYFNWNVFDPLQCMHMLVKLFNIQEWKSALLSMRCLSKYWVLLYIHRFSPSQVLSRKPNFIQSATRKLSIGGCRKDNTESISSNYIWFYSWLNPYLWFLVPDKMQPSPHFQFGSLLLSFRILVRTLLLAQVWARFGDTPSFTPPKVFHLWKPKRHLLGTPC